MEQKLALGLKEAAAAVGLSPWTLRHWIRQGRMRAVKLGRRVLVEPGELERLVEQGRNENTEVTLRSGGNINEQQMHC